MITVGNFPPGSDLLLLETIYHRANRKEGKDYDQIDLIYRDNSTGKKYMEEIKNPEYRFYMLKDEYATPGYNMHSIDRDMVDEYIVPYKNLTYELCKITGELDFYRECMNNKNYKSLKQININKRLFCSDRDINSQYRLRFREAYPEPTSSQPTKAYFDIEVDAIKFQGDIPFDGECALTVITLVCKDDKQVFTFVLRNPNHPKDTIYPGVNYDEYPMHKLPGQMLNDMYVKSCSKLENKLAHLGPDGTSEYIDKFIAEVGLKDRKRYNLYKLNGFRYNVLFYDEEIELIRDLFHFVVEMSPDVMTAWNISFDLNYLLARIRRLGYDVKDIVCDKRFSQKQCWYFVDNEANELHKRTDYGKISMMSVFVDQMITFANNRGNSTKLDSYSLDYIADTFCKIRKLSYSDITDSLVKLPYIDFERYFLYNIMDTIAQHCIEEKNSDLDILYAKALMNCERLDKVYRQTHFFTTRADWEYKKAKNHVVGNATALLLGKEKESYPGALVARPDLIQKEGEIVYGKKTSVYSNGNDFDIKSEYPNDMRENNMGYETMIARLVIPNDNVFPGQNRFKSHDFNNGGYFIDDMRSGNWLEFAHRWLHYPSYQELIEDIKDFFMEEHEIDLNMIDRGSNNLPITRYNTPIVRNKRLIKRVYSRKDSLNDRLHEYR